MNVQPNEVYLGDCREVLQLIDDETIDLVYLDPPFFTQKKQKLSNRNGYEYSFDDSWQDIETYVSYLEERVVEMHRVLKPTGSLFLHCDSTADHHLRTMLDRVFGGRYFRSEIIWTYKRWSNGKNGLIGNHQTILWYSKSQHFTFNQQYHEYSPSTNVDQITQERQRDARNKTVYKLDHSGNQVQTKVKRGVPLSDVWDIPLLNPKAKERTGYPTQKPVLLLKRIIEIASSKGDIVLDPFCGSGTTLVAAQQLERNWIGVDISSEAIALTAERIKHPVISDSEVLIKGRAAYNVQPDYVSRIVADLDGIPVQRNKGIDGFINGEDNVGLIPIRVQRTGEILSDALSMLLKAAKRRKCKRSVLVTTSNHEGLFPSEIPDDVLLIQSPFLQYKEWIAQT